jgi:hypothetical protein
MLSSKLEANAKLKFDLFSSGIKLTPEIIKEITKSHKIPLTIREGITGGLDIIFDRVVYVNAPVNEDFVQNSPYGITKLDSTYHLTKNGQNISKIKILPKPSYLGNKTRSGMFMEHIGQIFTDRIGFSPYLGCDFSKSMDHCRYCEIGAGIYPDIKNKLADILETLENSINDPELPTRHILLSGGRPPNNDMKYMLKIVREIRKRYSNSIYVMTPPPDDSETIEDFYSAGVDEIGMNIEIFDRTIAKKITPGKYKVGLDFYLDRLGHAADIFDKYGTRSVLIAGLEPIESTLNGVRTLMELGVMPILSPFRPVKGTQLEGHPILNGEAFYKVFEQGTELSKKYNIELGPLCIPCQNNTLTMPLNSRYKFY